MARPSYQLSEAQAAALERLAAEHNRAPDDLLGELLEPLLDDDWPDELCEMVAESDAEFERGDWVSTEEVRRGTQAIIDAARRRRA
jgi:hypothetical protein